MNVCATNPFKAQLAEITKKEKKPLVFIVDELDRCKPEFAIRLIERIKHFFDIPKVVFILAVNKNQLEESINNFYGFSSTANYLEKFIDFSVMLKNKDLDGSRYAEILNNYNKDYQLDLQRNELHTFIALCKTYSPNPRQLVKIINKFSLLKYDLNETQKVFLFIFLIYSELRLITSFTDTEFSTHFYNHHKNVFHKFNFNSTNSPAEKRASFFQFLTNDIYSKNSNTNIFAYLSAYIEYQNLSPAESINSKYRHYKDCKNHYYPTENQSNDLMDEWYKYVHMIEG